MVGQSMSTIKSLQSVGVCQEVGFIKKIHHLDLLKSHRHAARAQQGASWRMPTYTRKTCSNYFFWWKLEGWVIGTNNFLSKNFHTTIVADVRLLQREKNIPFQDIMEDGNTNKFPSTLRSLYILCSFQNASNWKQSYCWLKSYYWQA